MTVNVVRAFESYVDDVSNWYIRRSRRRFWESDATALRTLWYALVQGLRVVSPLMPFLTDHLWRRLTAPCPDAPESVHLAGWPEVDEPDTALLDEIGELRRVVELGRQARSSSGLKLRQPLRALVVEGAPLAEGHADEIAEELRIQEVTFGRVEASELRVKPNLPVLGPKLGRELGAVRTALEAGEFEELPGGRFRAAGHELAPEEVLVERHGREGWAVAGSDGMTVALDLHLDEDLLRRGRVYDLVHTVNTMRKDAGLELTDRIRLTLPEADADLLEHSDWIARETLAVSIEASGGEIRIERA
jgi:isoleucyl-tRNA synthetase